VGTYLFSSTLSRIAKASRNRESSATLMTAESQFPGSVLGSLHQSARRSPSTGLRTSLILERGKLGFQEKRAALGLAPPSC
jgi:hypothetical protein